MRASVRVVGLEALLPSPHESDHNPNPSAPILNISSVEVQAPMSPDSPFRSLANRYPHKKSSCDSTPNHRQISDHHLKQHKHIKMPPLRGHTIAQSAPTIPIPSVPMKKRFASIQPSITTAPDSAEIGSIGNGNGSGSNSNSMRNINNSMTNTITNQMTTDHPIIKHDRNSSLIHTLLTYGVHTNGNDTAGIHGLNEEEEDEDGDDEDLEEEEEGDHDETEDSESSISYSTPSVPPQHEHQTGHHHQEMGRGDDVESVYVMLTQKAQRLKALKVANDDHFSRKCALFRRDLSKYKQTNQYLKTQNKVLKEEIDRLRVRWSTMPLDESRYSSHLNEDEVSQLLQKRKQLPSRKELNKVQQLPNFVRKEFAKKSTATYPSMPSLNSNGNGIEVIEPVKSTVVHLSTESNSCHIPNHPYFPAEPIRKNGQSTRKKNNGKNGRREMMEVLQLSQFQRTESGKSGTTKGTLSTVTSSQLDEYHSISVPFIHHEISPALTATSEIYSTSDGASPQSSSSSAHAVKVALPHSPEWFDLTIEYLSDAHSQHSNGNNTNHSHSVHSKKQNIDQKQSHKVLHRNAVNPPPCSLGDDDDDQQPQLRVVKPPLPLTHIRQLTTIMEHTSIPLELIEQSLERMSGDWNSPSISTVSEKSENASVSLPDINIEHNMAVPSPAVTADTTANISNISDRIAIGTHTEDTMTMTTPTPPSATQHHVPTISYMSNNTNMLNELSLESSHPHSNDNNLKAIIDELVRMDSAGQASAAMSGGDFGIRDDDEVIQAPIGIMDNVFGVRL